MKRTWTGHLFIKESYPLYIQYISPIKKKQKDTVGLQLYTLLLHITYMSTMYHFGPTNPFLFVFVNKACCKPLYRWSLQVAQLIWHNAQIKETHNGWREPSFNLSPTVVRMYMVHVRTFLIHSSDFDKMIKFLIT